MEITRAAKVESIRTVSDAIACFDRMIGTGDRWTLWFRGVSNVDEHQLQTTLDRGSVSLRDREPVILDMFHEMSGQMASGSIGRMDYHRRLIVARHFGLPCRLLDWTESLLMALYFAVGEEPSETQQPSQSSSAAVWVLRPQVLNYLQPRVTYTRSFLGVSSTQQSPEFGHDIPYLHEKHEHLGRLVDEAFEASPSSDDQDTRTVAVRATAYDQRMVTQSSVFTLHGSPTPIEQSLGALNDALELWVIPPEAVTTIRGQLRDLGITESRVYPDLEHLARDLARRFRSEASALSKREEAPTP